MVRVFVSPSHLCTLYMIMYAKSTYKDWYNDVLILDTPPKKQSLIKVISDTQYVYPWAKIINLATPLTDETDFTTSTRKNLTRKIKGNFFAKPFYDFLLKRYLSKQQSKEAQMIVSQLAKLGEVIEVNMVTQTGINSSLFTLYPTATVNYFEHGQGDYFYIQKITTLNFNFYCLFTYKFKSYLEKKGQENAYVNKLNVDGFDLLAKQVIDRDPNGDEVKSVLNIPGKIVLILLENMQVYNVPENFYTDYLDLCVAQIARPEEYTFILKPHPGQSFRSIEISKEHMLNKLKLKTMVTETSNSISYSVEVLFTLWKDKTEHVFCVFSSALFYIAKLYRNDQTKYYYAYNFFKKYIKNAPPQIASNYYAFEELLENVFTENCIDMSK